MTASSASANVTPSPPRSSPPASAGGWRTPLVIVVCGCIVALLAFGPRSSLGFFLTPMSTENGWGRDVFGFAIAVQNLIWGIGQPIAGALADRFGTLRVLTVGVLFYAAGLTLMAWSNTPTMLDLTAGLLIGFGLAGSSFNIVIGAFGKLLPPQWRPLSFGAGTAAGSFGQFLFSPLAVALIDAHGWHTTLIVFGVGMLAMLPLSLALATPPAPPAAPHATTGVADRQTFRQALTEALGHRSYVLLVLGFFTCGFQLAFITVHLPSYLIDRGISAQVGGWTLAVIGLFNIVGSLSSGLLSSRMPKRWLLVANYFSRAIAIAIFVTMPASTAGTLLFGAVMGLLWLSTVPPTSGLVLVMFGTRWFAMLYGFAFFSHQVGGFLGVWIGGLAFERTGSYDLVWWLSVLFGVLSALLNVPIVEKPVERRAPAPA